MGTGVEGDLMVKLSELFPCVRCQFRAARHTNQEHTDGTVDCFPGCPACYLESFSRALSCTCPKSLSEADKKDAVRALMSLIGKEVAEESGTLFL